MKTEEVQIFVDLVVHYFDGISGQACRTGIPRLAGADDYEAKQITGIIGISGQHKGCVCFSTGPDMLRAAVRATLGDPGDVPNAEADMIGEIANTIAGNAMQAFNESFSISVPVICEDASKVRLPQGVPVFVIPINWQGHVGDLIIGMS
ncbi:MAG: chemotaxis protein CheX [Leptospirales bacterium]|jgi:chemotaxis protein CheX